MNKTPDLYAKHATVMVGVFEPGAVFTTLYFHRNLRMSPISQSVTLHKAGKASQGQIIKSIALNKLCRK